MSEVRFITPMGMDGNGRPRWHGPLDIVAEESLTVDGVKGVARTITLFFPGETHGAASEAKRQEAQGLSREPLVCQLKFALAPLIPPELAKLRQDLAAAREAVSHAQMKLVEAKQKHESVQEEVRQKHEAEVNQAEDDAEVARRRSVEMRASAAERNVAAAARAVAAAAQTYADLCGKLGQLNARMKHQASPLCKAAEAKCNAEGIRAGRQKADALASTLLVLMDELLLCQAMVTSAGLDPRFTAAVAAAVAEELGLPSFIEPLAPATKVVTPVEVSTARPPRNAITPVEEIPAPPTPATPLTRYPSTISPT
jgi:hypothetical protein